MFLIFFGALIFGDFFDFSIFDNFDSVQTPAGECARHTVAIWVVHTLGIYTRSRGIQSLLDSEIVIDVQKPEVFGDLSLGRGFSSFSGMFDNLELSNAKIF